MGQVLLVLAAIGVTIYSGVECLRTDDSEIRGLPKPLWLLVILAVPLIGGVLWILVGRTPPPSARRLRTMGPDDDIDFLSSLDRSLDVSRRRPDADDDEGGPASGK